MSRYIDAEWLLGVAKLSNGVADIDDIYNAPTIDIVRCGECKWEWTMKCPPHRMGLIHDSSDFCSYGERRE